MASRNHTTFHTANSIIESKAPVAHADPTEESKTRKGVPSTPLFRLASWRNLIVAAFILIDAVAIIFAERGIVVLTDCANLDLDRSIVRE